MPQTRETLVFALAGTSRLFGFLTIGVLLGTFVYFGLYGPDLLTVCLVVIGVGLLTGVIARVVANREEAQPNRRAKTGIRLSLVAPLVFLAAQTLYTANTRINCGISSSESSAIDNIQSMISAEAAYAPFNSGQYDLPSCLHRPWECLPGYDPNAPAFLDAEAASTSVRRGYVFTFHPGPPADSQGNVSASSLTAWAYVAVPEEPGVTGHRGFCGDATGRICATTDGSAPTVVEGVCSGGELLGAAASCEPTQ